MNSNPARKFITTFALLALFTIPAANPVLASEKYDHHISNFDQVTPEIYRGANPKDERDIRGLHDMGVKTVINLRMSGNGVDNEKEMVENAGMKFFHVPFGFSKPSDDKVKKVLTLMTDPKNQPVFIHCRQGADRTGMIIGIYRRLIQKWSFSQVYREMKDHHFKFFLASFKSKVKESPSNEPLVTACDQMVESNSRNKRAIAGVAPRETSM